MNLTKKSTHLDSIPESDKLAEHLYAKYAEIEADISAYFELIDKTYYQRNKKSPHFQNTQALNRQTDSTTPEFQEKLEEKDLDYIADQIHGLLIELTGESLSIRHVRETVREKQMELDEAFQKRHKALNLTGILASLITGAYDVYTHNWLGTGLSTLALGFESYLATIHNRELVNPLLKMIPKGAKKKTAEILPGIKDVIDETRKSTKVKCLRVILIAVLLSQASSMGSQVINGHLWENDTLTTTAKRVHTIATEFNIINPKRLQEIYKNSHLIYANYGEMNIWDKFIREVVGLESDTSYVFLPLLLEDFKWENEKDLYYQSGRITKGIHEMRETEKSIEALLDTDITKQTPKITCAFTETDGGAGKTINLTCGNCASLYSAVDCFSPQKSTLEIYANPIIYSAFASYLSFAFESGMLIWLLNARRKSKKYDKKVQQEIGMLKMPRYLHELKKLAATMQEGLKREGVDKEKLARKLNIILDLIEEESQEEDNPLVANYKNVLKTSVNHMQKEMEEESENEKKWGDRKTRMSNYIRGMVDKVTGGIFNLKRKNRGKQAEKLGIATVPETEVLDLVKNDESRYNASMFPVKLRKQQVVNLFKRVGYEFQKNSGKGSHGKFVNEFGMGKSTVLANRDQFSGEILVDMAGQLEIDMERFYGEYCRITKQPPKTI